MAHIDLDVAYAGDRAIDVGSVDWIDDAVTAFVGGIDVDWTVVETVSSSGGWPIVRFSGARSALERLLDAYGVDPEDVDFWYAQIVN